MTRGPSAAIKAFLFELTTNASRVLSSLRVKVTPFLSDRGKNSEIVSKIGGEVVTLELFYWLGR